MFARTWMPVLATFSVTFEHAAESDSDSVKQCLEGFSMAIRVACEHYMETEREAFVLALSKFTILSQITDMQPKNIAAIHTMLAMAYQNRNGLAESWIHVLACISRLVRLRIKLVWTGLDGPTAVLNNSHVLGQYITLFAFPRNDCS